ncbi:MAG TPA: tetratricopeptide repeat protein [Gemmatimonadaceae bacterium]|nr:tetratricopeptide repeat protein [Gemmatimonadaceae bacterium]
MTVKATAALVALSLAATTAGAQAGGQRPAQQPVRPKCDIQSQGSTKVSAAYEALQRFNGAQTEAEKPKALSDAVRNLTEPLDKPEAETARQWVLGQALVAWTLVEGQPTVGQRGTYGYATDPQGTIDLLYAADTVFDAVLAKVPECAEQIDNMRRLPYVATVNKAVELFNAGNTDSAKVLAERAMVIYPDAAPTYHLLGNIAVKQQDYPKAVELLGKAAELAAGDSSLADVRRTALESVATITQNQAQAAQGEEQKALAAKAAGYYKDLLAMQPDNSNAQTGLAQSLAMAGDTTALSGIYATMLAQPDKYSSFELLDAGVGALNNERNAEALPLIEASVKRNPYYRDGLFALAYVYDATGDYPKMVDAVKRLLAVDPSNPDNYNLLSKAYQGIIASLTDNGAKKPYTDSLVKASAAAQKLPVRVTFGDFQQPAPDQRVLNGTIENLGTAPADYVLKLEFLDASGNVVTTKEETVAGVQPKASKTFAVPATGQGIVAFRYAPLTPPQ